MAAPWCKIEINDPEGKEVRASRDITFNTLFEMVEKFVAYAGEVHSLNLDAFKLTRVLMAHNDWSIVRTHGLSLFPLSGVPTTGRHFQAMPLIEADLVGHQIRHQVTAGLLGMPYKGQSAALHEHLADCEGIVFKQWTLKQAAEQSDFTFGRSYFPRRLQQECMRNMLKPGTAYDHPDVGKDYQPGNMAHYLITPDDQHCGLANCGIPNRVFANFAKGLGGYAWKHAIKIWFAASVACASKFQEPSIAEFGASTVDACSLLFGNQPKKARKLLRGCWADVGVEVGK